MALDGFVLAGAVVFEVAAAFSFCTFFLCFLPIL
jgi:hypothetical protein